jgi:hypothetical protein
MVLVENEQIKKVSNQRNEHVAYNFTQIYWRNCNQSSSTQFVINSHSHCLLWDLNFRLDYLTICLEPVTTNLVTGFQRSHLSEWQLLWQVNLCRQLLQNFLTTPLIVNKTNHYLPRLLNFLTQFTINTQYNAFVDLNCGPQAPFVPSQDRCPPSSTMFSNAWKWARLELSCGWVHKCTAKSGLLPFLLTSSDSLTQAHFQPA